MTDHKETYKYWLDNLPDKKLRASLDGLSEEEVALAFSGELMFGTGGIRSIMGAGSSRLNIYTMGKIAKGTADYLCSTAKGKKRVVIAFDNRKNSRAFARLCATVFASAGIESVVTKNCSPTPYLSFMVRRLSAVAGVMITASHNPKEYNGYKLYDKSGCQILDDDSLAVSEFIKKADTFYRLPHNFLHYQKQGLIKVTDAYKAYLEAVSSSLSRVEYSLKFKQSISRLKNESLFKEYDFEFGKGKGGGNRAAQDELRIIYTPLCGTGGFLAPQLLKNEGAVFVVPSEAKPNENFSGCKVSNPEKPEAFENALVYAKNFDADLVLASDPDADRMGAVTRRAEGDYRFLSGNQIGVLLLDYILRQNQKRKNACIHGREYSGMATCSDCGKPLAGGRGEYINSPLVVRSIVSSPMADEIAKSYGAEIVKVPTGFKYIGDIVAKLEKQRQKDRFLFGFEESHGYLSGDYARDKDGLQAASLLARYASHLKAEGQTLSQVLDGLYKKHGYFFNQTLSFRFDGTGGADKINGFMKSVRGGSFLPTNKVLGITDYLQPKQGEYPADMVEYTAEGGEVSVIIRPSGTEPLIKAYITVKAASPADAEAMLENYKNLCNDFFV